MKKNTILMLTAVFVVILAAACSAPAPATQAAAPAVEQPVQQQPAAVQPTQEQPAAAPVATDAPAQTTLVFPDTVAAETYCANKIPYQNIFLEDGATFEPVDANSELKCSDSGTDVDGKNVITCTGKELWTYDLKITTSQGSGIMKINIGACPLPQ